MQPAARHEVVVGLEAARNGLLRTFAALVDHVKPFMAHPEHVCAGRLGDEGTRQFLAIPAQRPRREQRVRGMGKSSHDVESGKRHTTLSCAVRTVNPQ